MYRKNYTILSVMLTLDIFKQRNNWVKDTPPLPPKKPSHFLALKSDTCIRDIKWLPGVALLYGFKTPVRFYR